MHEEATPVLHGSTQVEKERLGTPLYEESRSRNGEEVAAKLARHRDTSVSLESVPAPTWAMRTGTAAPSLFTKLDEVDLHRGPCSIQGTVPTLGVDEPAAVQLGSGQRIFEEFVDKDLGPQVNRPEHPGPWGCDLLLERQSVDVTNLSLENGAHLDLRVLQGNDLSPVKGVDDEVLT
ncbi:MAG: hypothetical protein QM755_09835 [Luteolibacter sp.]